MNSELLRIDELHLQIPGLTEDEARQLGLEVANRLADQMPASTRPRRLGRLYLHLPLPAAAAREQLADLIVSAILEKLA